MKKRITSILLAIILILPAMLSAVTPAAAATDVARIGDTYYETLADAFDALVSGQTLTLLEDVELDATIYYEMETGDSIVIDGNHKTITTTLDGELEGVISLVGGSALVMNLNIELTTDSMTCFAFFETYTTLYNCDFSATGENSPAMFVSAITPGTYLTIVSGTFGASGEDEASYAIIGAEHCRLGDDSAIASILPDTAAWNDDDVTNLAVSSDVDYVARIGIDLYDTLQDALDAVMNGETITLLRDVELNSSNYIDKAADGTFYTIDGNGKTITVLDDAPNVLQAVESEKTINVLIRDLTIINDEEAGDTYALDIFDSPDVSVTLDNCTFDIPGGCAVYTDSGALTILSGSYRTGGGTNVLYVGGDADVTIVSGTFDADDEEGVAIFVVGDAQVAPALGSVVVDIEPSDADWLNEATYVEIAVNEDAVARIDTDLYDTLQEAIEEVEDGQTIKILRDFDVIADTFLNQNVAADTAYTIDGANPAGGNFTITLCESDNSDVLFASSGYSSVDVTVKNLNIRDVSEENGNNFAFALYNDSSATLENCSFDMPQGNAIWMEDGELTILSGYYGAGDGYDALGVSEDAKVTIVEGEFDTKDADNEAYAIYAEDGGIVALADDSVVVDILADDADWLNDAWYVAFGTDEPEPEPEPEPSDWAGFSPAPCMLIEVKDTSGNLIKETGFVVSRKAGGVVGVNFVSASEIKCTDKSGVLGFSGISGMTYIIEKDGRKAEFVFSANKTITVTMQ